jgi:homogentisate 1,2-dioxygenase
MRYHTLGELPAKRHVQVRRSGRLLSEEVMGFEGFSGNESILYHLYPPARLSGVGVFEPMDRPIWTSPSYVHRHIKTQLVAPGGDTVTGRQLLAWNNDVEISSFKPTHASDAFFRNGEGDEIIFIHHGGGELQSVFGRLRFSQYDYLVIPRQTTYRFVLDEIPQVWMSYFTRGEVETPHRYRNRYGQLREGAPFSQRDFHPPNELVAVDERGEYDLIVRVRGGRQHYTMDHHPFDVVGWDGYVYPYTFNITDFEPIVGRLHQPPPVHQTFEGPNFVICSFCPRPLDYDPNAVPIPYSHANIQSDELSYYLEGDTTARAGFSAGSISFHPNGLVHGPQPGKVEQSLGKTHTAGFSVMCDTFNPLHLTPIVADIEDPDYVLSWRAEPSLLIDESVSQ